MVVFGVTVTSRQAILHRLSLFALQWRIRMRHSSAFWNTEIMNAESKQRRTAEVGIEFCIELLLVVYQFGHDQMDFPHNYWAGLFCWLLAIALGIRIFWIFPGLEPLGCVWKALMSAVLVLGFIWLEGGLVIESYKKQFIVSEDAKRLPPVPLKLVPRPPQIAYEKSLLPQLPTGLRAERHGTTDSVTVEVEHAGNLRDRALDLARDVTDDLYRNGWPPGSPALPGTPPLPTQGDEAIRWTRSRSRIFRWRCLKRIREIRDDFSKHDYRDRDLDRYLEGEAENEQLYGLDFEKWPVLNPSEIVRVSESLTKLANDLPARQQP
jgi:hypothetical protein